MTQKACVLSFGLLAAVALVLGGCARRYQPVLDAQVMSAAHGGVEVGAVTNATGRTFDIDIEQMWGDALMEELRDEELLRASSSEAGDALVMISIITEYARGNAFKRWLVPAWGTTALTVECEVRRRSDSHSAGSLQARQTVSWGGGYTVGAWRTIFNTVAKEVAKDLRSEIERK